LIPGGRNVKVTDANKAEFIKKKCYFIGYKAVKDQLSSMQEGFNKVI
jgi:hypothetical protein